MKRITIVALGCLLTLNIALAADPAPSDQKWLTAVEKMVTQGGTTISTPSKDRVDLLKDWAKKKGFSIEVTKSDKGYRAELSAKRTAKN